jgi:hypothetical protein
METLQFIFPSQCFSTLEGTAIGAAFEEVRVMNEGRRRLGGGAAVLGILLLTVLAAVVAYNVGVSHGAAQQFVAQAGQSVQAAPGAPPVYPYPYPYPYGWHRPWGFGFGFPILFFVLIWFLVIRGLFWGRRWRHGYYDGGWQGVPPAFDHWHRQAHQQMKEQPPADDSGRRG